MDFHRLPPFESISDKILSHGPHAISILTAILLPVASLLMPIVIAYCLLPNACFQTHNPPCLCSARQAKRTPQSTPNHVALRGEPQGRTLVICGHAQRGFWFKVETEVLRIDECHHFLDPGDCSM